MQDALHTYLDSTVAMRKALAERTPDEIDFDKEVVDGSRKGLPIKNAFESAALKHPAVALQWRDDLSSAIGEHYEWLMRHEDIMARTKT